MPYLVPLLASGLALLFGCAVEAATGYGSAVVALPVMELAFPSHMPALLILLGTPLVVLMVGIERTYIDAPAAVQVSSGLIFGTLLAIPVLDLVSGRPLRLLFGFASLAALVSLTVMRSPSDRYDRSLAGGAPDGTGRCRLRCREAAARQGEQAVPASCDPRSGRRVRHHPVPGCYVTARRSRSCTMRAVIGRAGEVANGPGKGTAADCLPA